MSDHTIILIPEDPRHVPDEERQRRAIAKFHEIAPNSDEIREILSDSVQFFDCGGNLEKIVCPACHKEIPIPWWQAQMDEEHGQAYPLVKQPSPCCGALRTLHELTYEWPQGFGRFGIEAMNPSVRQFDTTLKSEFENILGCPLRVIYRQM